MKVKGIDPTTGKEVEIEITAPENSFFENMRDFKLSDDAIKQMIEKLNISADAKAFLYKISKVTLTAGEFVVKIGRKIVDAVFYIMKEFPMATFGMVFGGIAGALISGIPVVGHALGALVTPIFVAIGFVGGLVLDFQDKLLERKIASKVAEFSPLGGSQSA